MTEQERIEWGFEPTPLPPPPEWLVGSDEQEAVWKYMVEQDGNAVIDSVAGGSKTTVQVEGAKRVAYYKPKTKIKYVAFAKTNQEDAQVRLGTAATASTFHSFGRSALYKAKLTIADGIVSNRMKGIIDDIRKFPWAEREFRNACWDLGKFAREAGAETHQDIKALIPHHGLDFVSAEQENDAAALVLRALDVARTPESFEEGIDFTDMLWLPWALDLPLPQSDLLLVDECLPGNTPIYFKFPVAGDHGTIDIKTIVDTKYSGKVYSYDEYTGKTVEKSVIGWHKIPLSKKMVRVTTRRIGRREDGTRFNPKTEYVRFGNRYLVCTADHKVFRQGQWISADALRPGDIVTQESHAPKDSAFTHKVKMGLSGKETLSTLMLEKNSSGVCGAGTRNGRISVRGGNGRGLTSYQEALLARLGAPWVAEAVVILDGHPYKIDIANVEDKIAIELDGPSHNSPRQKALDAKKDALLRALGWTVYRLTNDESLRITDDLLQERFVNSPVDAEVLAVEEWIPDDPFVYDITVEDTHCYYANGVLVHNCQDLNRIQHWFVKNAAKRTMIVGDPFQSIYGWRGADLNSMDRLVQLVDPGMPTFPLTYTWRCPTSHVAAAQLLVPHIKARPGAPEGRFELATWERYIAEAQPGDMTMCRLNAPLFEAMADFEKLNRVAGVIGSKEFETGLAKLVKVSEKRTLDATLTEARHWTENKISTMIDRGQNNWTRHEENLEILVSLASGSKDLLHLKSKIDALSKEKGKEAIKLGSVHKQKGREAKRVWILRGGLMPLSWAKPGWQTQQELNLLYVALTRGLGDATITFVDEVPGPVESFIAGRLK